SLRRAMAHYYATIEQIDHHVGRMIDVLIRKGISDHTMILYTSDHGELLGYHHMLLKGGYIYDALMKVPLVIKYPESAHAGSSTDALVNNIDVAPTILAQAKCAPAPAMHGRDLAAGGDGPEITFCENGRGGQAVARSHTRKLILVPGKNVRLFYDLEKDPCETVNRVDDPAYADDVAHLTQAIEDWRGFDNLSKVYLDEDAPVIDQPNVPSRDDDHRDRMAAYCAEKMKGDWAGD
ncbi:MAG: sulfatase-like hydrolase/transferase, partial [bacterium]|nr:sulfatase-like hydrolase/transferase [bacterium]